MLGTPESAPAPEPEPRNTAERRQLTVMFVDLVGSTALSTKLDPEDLRGVINAYQWYCTDVVRRNGGFVAKYMGDGVLAYFGYPRADEHDAERSVRAALALIEAVPKLATATGSPLQVRIGIATGLVVVGDLIGTGAAQERAVVGETPNLAARLQALAEPGAVVISATTRQLTGGMFEYSDLGPVALKGFAEGTPAWRVVGASAAESRFEALRATATPLVGREEELDLLTRRWEQAKLGEGQLVLISGEPGIGKSRIAQTLVERISTEPHTRLRYFCSPYHQDSALHPMITQLERAAAFRRDDTPEQRLSKLEAILARGSNDLADVVPLIAELLSIPNPNCYPVVALTPQKRKEKTLRALLAQVEGLAARQPLLMVVEDAHWIDPTSRESLDLTFDRLPNLRVLVIVTFRPEFTPSWVGSPHATLISLNRLVARQRVEMIRHLTAGKALPKEVADQIVDRTDGVPLFIEELTKDVVESGIVTDTGNRYEPAGPMAPFAIPTTLHASLLARLDRLAPTREIAQIGAAIGRSFSHELISAVAQMPQQQVDDALGQLVGAELIFRRGTPPDAEYSFKHALVQDAAYSTLLRSRRQQLHARIVAILETQFPEKAAAQAALMAQHCAHADLPERAVDYWLKAGKEAFGHSAMTEAVALLQRGLDSLRSLPDSSSRQQRELDLQTALGPALIATKGYGASAVGDVYVRARALARHLNHAESLSLVLLFGGHFGFHLIRAEHKLALSIAQETIESGRAANDPILELFGDSFHGVSYSLLGDFAIARTRLEQCNGLSDPGLRARSGAMMAEDQFSHVLAFLALNLSQLGYIDQARARLDAALAAARQSGRVYPVAQALSLACWVERVINSSAAVQRHADEAIALSDEHGFPHWLGWGLIHNGWSRAALGQAQEGLALLSKGLEAVQQTGSIASTPYALALRAETYAKLGKPTEGLKCLEQAAEMIEVTDERYAEADVHRLRGDLLVLNCDHPAAEGSYREALAVARRQGGKVLELKAAVGLARLWRDQGGCREAHDLLAPVYGWFTDGFDTPVLKEAKALLEQLAV